MRRPIYFLFVTIFLLIVQGCRKDHEPRSLSIKIDQTEDMKIEFFTDTSKYSVKIDLDNDSVPEFLIKHSISYVQPNVLNGPSYVKIISNDGNKILTETIRDSIYRYKTIDTSNLGGTVNINNHYYTVCDDDNNAVFYKINKRSIPIYLITGNRISLNDNLSQTDLLLHQESYTYGSISNYGGDTSVTSVYTNERTCTHLTYGHEYTVGFYALNQAKLGWFKFSVYPDYKILLSEVAYQE